MNCKNGGAVAIKGRLAFGKSGDPKGWHQRHQEPIALACCVVGDLEICPHHSIFSILTVGLDMVLWFLICYHHSASTNHIKRLWSHLFGRAHAHLLSTDLGCTLIFINAQTLRRFRRLRRLDSGSCRHILKGRLVEKLPSYRKILTLRKESNRTKQPQKGLQKKDFGDGGASKTPWQA